MSHCRKEHLPKIFSSIEHFSYELDTVYKRVLIFIFIKILAINLKIDNTEKNRYKSSAKFVRGHIHDSKKIL
jgi:hypothetical protein